MKIPEIKRLAEGHTLEELRKAEDAILESLPEPFQVNGEDEGERLTHVLAAIWIRNEMDDHGTEFRDALRQYSQRVRNSIS